MTPYAVLSNSQTSADPVHFHTSNTAQTAVPSSSLTQSALKLTGTSIGDPLFVGIRAQSNTSNCHHASHRSELGPELGQISEAYPVHDGAFKAAVRWLVQFNLQLEPNDDLRHCLESLADDDHNGSDERPASKGGLVIPRGPLIALLTSGKLHVKVASVLFPGFSSQREDLVSILTAQSFLDLDQSLQSAYNEMLWTQQHFTEHVHAAVLDALVAASIKVTDRELFDFCKQMWPSRTHSVPYDLEDAVLQFVTMLSGLSLEELERDLNASRWIVVEQALAKYNISSLPKLWTNSELDQTDGVGFRHLFMAALVAVYEQLKNMHKAPAVPTTIALAAEKPVPAGPSRLLLPDHSQSDPASSQKRATEPLMNTTLEHMRPPPSVTGVTPVNARCDTVSEKKSSDASRILSNCELLRHPICSSDVTNILPMQRPRDHDDTSGNNRWQQHQKNALDIEGPAIVFKPRLEEWVLPDSSVANKDLLIYHESLDLYPDDDDQVLSTGDCSLNHQFNEVSDPSPRSPASLKRVPTSVKAMSAADPSLPSYSYSYSAIVPDGPPAVPQKPANTKMTYMQRWQKQQHSAQKHVVTSQTGNKGSRTLLSTLESRGPLPDSGLMSEPTEADQELAELRRLAQAQIHHHRHYSIYQEMEPSGVKYPHQNGMINVSALQTSGATPINACEVEWSSDSDFDIFNDGPNIASNLPTTRDVNEASNTDEAEMEAKIFSLPNAQRTLSVVSNEWAEIAKPLRHGYKGHLVADSSVPTNEHEEAALLESMFLASEAPVSKCPQNDHLERNRTHSPSQSSPRSRIPLQLRKRQATLQQKVNERQKIKQDEIARQKALEVERRQILWMQRSGASSSFSSTSSLFDTPLPSGHALPSRKQHASLPLLDAPLPVVAALTRSPQGSLLRSGGIQEALHADRTPVMSRGQRESCADGSGQCRSADVHVGIPHHPFEVVTKSHIQGDVFLRHGDSAGAACQRCRRCNRCS
ncbi:hypothetical protein CAUPRSCDRAFT_10264 [Caulochytrium protostelioides]|uniref:Uncharacterized protein n=1 Tax=Caulochytrium protostelioides TaxID=1555241 RepID=A0A4P9X1P4_9FUNG|nr:hypothetical protein CAUPRSCDRAFT_10264 [Caulochytrium protostelioides]